MNKLWPLVDREGRIVAASSAPDDATEYLTWDEWVKLNLDNRGQVVKYEDILPLMKREEALTHKKDCELK